MAQEADLTGLRMKFVSINESCNVLLKRASLGIMGFPVALRDQTAAAFYNYRKACDFFHVTGSKIHLDYVDDNTMNNKPSVAI